MALNITETTSSLADMVGKLYTFATTAGAGNPAWTGDRNPASHAGEFGISKAAVQSNTNDIQVAAGWDTGTPDNLGLYQYDHASGAGNYDATADPWGQDNDSGNGFAGTANASLDNERHAAIGNTPLQYWAFAGNSPQAYLHVVVKTDATTYVHFGWGELAKFNNWQGGAYCYGHLMNGTGTSGQTVNVGSTMLLDGYFNSNSSILKKQMATLNCESLPDQPTGGKWAVVAGNQSDLGTDRQSNNGGGATDKDRALFVGGYRANDPARCFGSLPASLQSGFVPGYPIVAWYWKQSPSAVYGPMGIMPDVRGINISQFTPGQEITVGSDTWVVFPAAKKGADNESGSSKNQGIMYKKNP